MTPRPPPWLGPAHRGENGPPAFGTWPVPLVFVVELAIRAAAEGVDRR
ncbi:MAG: hypothetical protein QOK26_757, partial [Pseudonocardiales bacterium]|nr:hypothetical protein [Pseudonocardiales bacterium]